ncbi:MAG: glycine C-acetyltransferase [Candidatus Magasanikbacteria bacterium]|nr:glycine C-acetyltransferase [Candidatus Magasanikbacteria bacterium]
MFSQMKQLLQQQLSEIKDQGLSKDERFLQSKQGVAITTNGKEVLNFCANNYLGFANHPEVLKSAHETLDKWGYGMSSVRFICGTQEQHKTLEKKISEFLGTDDTILYSSCFDANGGLFETLLGEEDAIISDQLNHASIIDGIRLCKAERHRYAHSNMEELEEILQKTQDKRFRMIATDGVFSMDGDIAKLKEICDLADKYDALVMVDDSHATGFTGETGRGTPEYCGVQGRVDIITSTFGKALGGATGGFTSGRQEIIDYLRQRSRPYLFSNTLAPVMVGTSIRILELLSETKDSLVTLRGNTKYFREKMSEAGFELHGTDHPIVPVMLYDAKVAKGMANALLDEGIYVIGFSYPVVPQDQARIRVQISAGHTREDLDACVAGFVKVGMEFNIVK